MFSTQFGILGFYPRSGRNWTAPWPPGRVPDLSAKAPNLPSEADLDRAFTFVKNAWRRLVDMMVDLQRDVQRKG